MPIAVPSIPDAGLSMLMKFALRFLFSATALLSLWGGLIIVLRNRGILAARMAGVGLMLWSVPYVLRSLKLNLDESLLPWLVYTGILAYAVFSGAIVMALFDRSLDAVMRRRCRVAAVILIFISLSLVCEFTLNAEYALVARSLLLITLGIMALWNLGISDRYDAVIEPVSSSVAAMPVEDPLASRLSEYASAVLKWFEDDKPYLNPRFKLSDTTRVLPLNRSYLSRIYNEGIGKSFNELVRDSRVAYAAALLDSVPGIAMSEVCRRSGFGSVSTFHRCFSAVYGMSPSEYVRAETRRR